MLAGFGLLFVMAGAVQFNDVDPYLWVSLYTGAAALSFGALVAPIPRWLIVLEAFAAAFALAMMIIDGFQWAFADSEAMRELGGVAIVFLHAAVLGVLARAPNELWVDGRRLH